jgi:hypothetical protein
MQQPHPRALPTHPPTHPLPSQTALQDATQLAVRLVSNYGLSGLGITTYAPPPGRMGPSKAKFEVAGAWLRIPTVGLCVEHAMLAVPSPGPTG